MLSSHQSTTNTPVTASAANDLSSPSLVMKERLRRFYSLYNPSCVSTVDAILSSYEGREEELMRVLTTKYGPEPPPPEAQALEARSASPSNPSAPRTRSGDDSSAASTQEKTRQAQQRTLSEQSTHFDVIHNNESNSKELNRPSPQSHLHTSYSSRARLQAMIGPISGPQPSNVITHTNFQAASPVGPSAPHARKYADQFVSSSPRTSLEALAVLSPAPSGAGRTDATTRDVWGRRGIPDKGSEEDNADATSSEALAKAKARLVAFYSLHSPSMVPFVEDVMSSAGIPSPHSANEITPRLTASEITAITDGLIRELENALASLKKVPTPTSILPHTAAERAHDRAEQAVRAESFGKEGKGEEGKGNTHTARVTPAEGTTNRRRGDADDVHHVEEETKRRGNIVYIRGDDETRGYTQQQQQQLTKVTPSTRTAESKARRSSSPPVDMPRTDVQHFANVARAPQGEPYTATRAAGGVVPTGAKGVHVVPQGGVYLHKQAAEQIAALEQKLTERDHVIGQLASELKHKVDELEKLQYSTNSSQTSLVPAAAALELNNSSSSSRKHQSKGYVNAKNVSSASLRGGWVGNSGAGSRSTSAASTSSSTSRGAASGGGKAWHSSGGYAAKSAGIEGAAGAYSSSRRREVVLSRGGHGEGAIVTATQQQQQHHHHHPQQQQQLQQPPYAGGIRSQSVTRALADKDSEMEKLLQLLSDAEQAHKAQVEDSERTIKALSRRLALAESELVEANEKLVLSDARSAEMSEELQQKSNSGANKEKEKNLLAEKKEAKQKQQQQEEEYIEEIERLRQFLSGYESTIDITEKKAKALGAEVNRLTSEAAVSEHHLRMARMKAGYLQDELNARDERIEGMVAERRGLEQQLNGLLREIGALRLQGGANSNTQGEREAFNVLVAEIQKRFEDHYEHRLSLAEAETQQYYAYAKRQISNRDAMITDLTNAVERDAKAASEAAAASLVETFPASERRLAEEVAKLHQALHEQRASHRTQLSEALEKRSEAEVELRRLKAQSPHQGTSSEGRVHHPRQTREERSGNDGSEEGAASPLSRTHIFQLAEENASSAPTSNNKFSLTHYHSSPLKGVERDVVLDYDESRKSTTKAPPRHTFFSAEQLSRETHNQGPRENGDPNNQSAHALHTSDGNVSNYSSTTNGIRASRERNDSNEEGYASAMAQAMRLVASSLSEKRNRRATSVGGSRQASGEGKGDAGGGEEEAVEMKGDALLPTRFAIQRYHHPNSNNNSKAFPHQQLTAVQVGAWGRMMALEGKPQANSVAVDTYEDENSGGGEENRTSASPQPLAPHLYYRGGHSSFLTHDRLNPNNGDAAAGGAWSHRGAGGGGYSNQVHVRRMADLIHR